MNWIDLVGGIGQGVSQGTADLRAMQTEQLQRQAMKQEADLRAQAIATGANEQARRAALMGIQREGRSQGDISREEGAVLSAHGDVEGGRRALDAGRHFDETARREAVTKKYQEMVPMLQKDPTGFLMQYAPAHYNKMVADGKHAIAQSVPGGIRVLVKDPVTGIDVMSRDIPNEQISVAANDVFQKLYLNDIGALSPDMFLKQFELGMKKDEGASQDVLRRAQAKYAEGQAGELAEKVRTGNYGDIDYRRKLGDAALKNAGANADRAEADKFGSPVQLGIDDKGAPIWGMPVRTGAGISFHPIEVPSSVKSVKKPGVPEVDPKLKEIAYRELSDAGTDPKRVAAVRGKYPEVFGAKSDPILEALKNAPPPGKKGEEKTEPAGYRGPSRANVYRPGKDESKDSLGIRRGSNSFRNIEED